MGMFRGASVRSLVAGFLFLQIFLCQNSLSHAANKGVVPERDPRQISWFVTDLDGTFAKNLGGFWVYRTQMTQDAFFPEVTGLPDKIFVPTDDYEGNIGPRIAKRLGRIGPAGNFIFGSSHKKIRLSNGQDIIPAYYYLNPEQSYSAFRTTHSDYSKGAFAQSVDEKVAEGKDFLLESSVFMSFVYSGDYADRLQGSVLTKRGHESAETKYVLEKKIRDPNKWGTRELPERAYVNLSHPDFAEYAGSKINYLRKAYFQMSNRVMSNFGTPHFLVVFENDRQFLKEIDDLFKNNLSGRGEFANPVVPILVNLVEPEVFAHPDGQDWNRHPDEKVTSMSRVKIYWPGKVEATDNFSRVLELSLGVDATTAQNLLDSKMKKVSLCRNVLEGIEVYQ